MALSQTAKVMAHGRNPTKRSEATAKTLADHVPHALQRARREQSKLFAKLAREHAESIPRVRSAKPSSAELTIGAIAGAYTNKR